VEKLFYKFVFGRFCKYHLFFILLFDPERESSWFLRNTDI